MDAKQVAAILYEIAELLEIKGESSFKARAYSHAARVIESSSEDLRELVQSRQLGELEGIGESLREKITTLVQTGHLPYYEELKASLPAGLLTLLRVPGLGPKKVKVLYDKLQVVDVESLERVCHDGSAAKLPGFGAKTAANLLAGIHQLKSYSGQYRFIDVIGLAEELEHALEKCSAVQRVSLAGSLRRGKEVTKDIDLVASSKTPEKVTQFFCKLPQVERVTGHGDTKASVILRGGVACDLRVVENAQFPYALHHFTGSKEHNIAMRQRAISQGMKLSEWGLFEKASKEEQGAVCTKQTGGADARMRKHPCTSTVVEKEPSKLVSCKNEEDIFRALGLQSIPVELRENLGEIEAAERHEIPKLIEYEDIRGAFHNHTTASDGENSLEEMAEAAADLGWEYLGIADHSKSSAQAHGLSEERLLAQIEAIHRYNAAKPKCILFAGTECDILKDGKLDFEDKLLAQLDYVVASVHSALGQTEEDMTKRVLRAIENPHVTMIGHLTGRLLLERAPSAVNISKIIDAAAETGTWIELNANPWRLDMDWRHWKAARDKGVKCVINPDAHHTSHLQYVRLGVQMARKGWLRRDDVINTRPLTQIRKLLQEKQRLS